MNANTQRRPDLSRLVNARPATLRAEIRRAEQEAGDLLEESNTLMTFASALRTLLVACGETAPEAAATPAVVPTGPITAFDALGAGSAKGAGSLIGPARRPTLAEASVRILATAGAAELHGRKLLEALQRAGYMKDAKQPMANLQATLTRDARVQRVPGKVNTWRLRETGARRRPASSRRSQERLARRSSRRARSIG